MWCLFWCLSEMVPILSLAECVKELLNFLPNIESKQLCHSTSRKKMYPVNVVVELFSGLRRGPSLESSLGSLAFIVFISELLRVGRSPHICLVHIEMGKLRNFPSNWYSASHWRNRVLPRLSTQSCSADG